MRVHDRRLVLHRTHGGVAGERVGGVGHARLPRVRAVHVGGRDSRIRRTRRARPRTRHGGSRGGQGEGGDDAADEGTMGDHGWSCSERPAKQLAEDALAVPTIRAGTSEPSIYQLKCQGLKLYVSL